MQNEAAYDLAGRKLFIGLPAYDFKVGVKLAISLAEFCVKAQQHGVQIQISNVSGCSVVSRVRNIIADQFLESGCDHLMMIDSDMCFNADDIFRLMAWNTTKPIVAGIGAARKKEKSSSRCWIRTRTAALRWTRWVWFGQSVSEPASL